MRNQDADIRKYTIDAFRKGELEALLTRHEGREKPRRLVARRQLAQTLAASSRRSYSDVVGKAWPSKDGKYERKVCVGGEWG